MYQQNSPVRISIITLLLFVTAGINAENAEEALIKSCGGYISSNEIPEDSVCYEYINGFIDGAELTDSAIIENIIKEEKEFSNFFDRAYKTRVGSKRIKRPATYYAKYCLPEDQSRKMIIEELVHQIDESMLTKQSFKVTLYETMKRVYKCDID